jgi:hypothetical protein
MENTGPKAPESDEPLREALTGFRDALLRLHKALIDSERIVYEAQVGAIHSPHHFFHLLTNDPWFAWLRPISQLIVAVDEALDADDPVTSDSADALINQAVFLLIPAQTGGDFAARYLAALQRDPRVVLAHAKVSRRIPVPKPRA